MLHYWNFFPPPTKEISQLLCNLDLDSQNTDRMQLDSLPEAPSPAPNRILVSPSTRPPLFTFFSILLSPKFPISQPINLCLQHPMAFLAKSSESLHGPSTKQTAISHTLRLATARATFLSTTSCSGFFSFLLFFSLVIKYLNKTNVRKRLFRLRVPEGQRPL